MYLTDLESGTNLSVVFEDESELRAQYIDRIDHVNFLIQSIDSDDNLNRYIGSSASISFFTRDLCYTFFCKITGFESGEINIINCTATSLFKEVPRRDGHRINTNLRTKVFSYKNSENGTQKKEFICEAVSVDLSRTGIRLWSDDPIDAPLQTTFLLEVAVPFSLPFTLSAVIVRNQNNTSTRSYSFDYGFVFPDNMYDRAEKLVFDIIKSRLHSVR